MVSVSKIVSGVSRLLMVTVAPAMGLCSPATVTLTFSAPVEGVLFVSLGINGPVSVMVCDYYMRKNLICEKESYTFVKQAIDKCINVLYH